MMLNLMCVMLISLTEVMNEYDLGPNGAQILAADLVAAQAWMLQKNCMHYLVN